MAISRWQDPDAKSEASSLIKAVTNSTFIVTLFCVVAVTNNIDILSERLQEKGTSLNEAMKHIQDVITVLEDRKTQTIVLPELQSGFSTRCYALKLRWNVLELPNDQCIEITQTSQMLTILIMD